MSSFMRQYDGAWQRAYREALADLDREFPADLDREFPTVGYPGMGVLRLYDNNGKLRDARPYFGGVPSAAIRFARAPQAYVAAVVTFTASDGVEHPIFVDTFCSHHLMRGDLAQVRLFEVGP